VNVFLVKETVRVEETGLRGSGDCGGAKEGFDLRVRDAGFALRR